MKNATMDDVLWAMSTGLLDENIMYKYGSRKVHGKRCSGIGITNGNCCGETSDGVVVSVQVNRIEPLSKFPAQHPKRNKRKPIKGTRPEKLIPMSADVKLKVGDRVVLADGARSHVVQVDDSGMDAWIYNIDSHGWFDAHGEYILGGERITHKIVPYAEQENPSLDSSPEQEAFEKGYWAAHQAKPDSRVPPFAAGWKVTIILGDNTLSVDCWHTPGREGTMYRSNGDPGDPPEPEEIEIERIMIGQEDVTEMMAALYVQRGYGMSPVRHVPVWGVLEQKALEAICYSNS